jgi:hypothetical protein
MATITIKFVGNQYDENGAIKVSEKDIAFPENVTLDITTMANALQTVISSHRSFLYSQQSTNEASKKEPNNDTLNRLQEAMTACNDNNPAWNADTDEEYRAVQLLAFCIDNAMHSTFLNGRRVMSVPAGGTDLLTAFRDYKDKRVSFGELKKQAVAFGEGFNDIPFLKDRTIRFTDEDVKALIAMYEGIGQPLRWNKKGINGKRITKASLLQQVGLMALKKSFKFSEAETKTKKVVEF